MFKSTSMVTSKSTLIKIKHLSSNLSVLWVFGPMCAIKTNLYNIDLFLNYHKLIVLITNLIHAGLKRKIAYCESVAHLLKFAFINSNKGYTCYMRVKGVGYKIEQKNSNYLLATLGYSHKITIQLPTYMKVCILKKRIIFWSYSLVKLQQFCHIINSLRKKDPYNGKGILQPHLQKKLKVGKISRI